ncbi:hypothetical protein Scep_019797 [Stephania cephalantha]|uniref:Uncharacterized protein n=1 Tax=Stephania cephalantha TaxID=152367 RepID=A0AAP0IBU9_9MAGN
MATASGNGGGSGQWRRRRPASTMSHLKVPTTGGLRTTEGGRPIFKSPDGIWSGGGRRRRKCGGGFEGDGALGAWSAWGGNSAMASYSHNYGRFEDSHYYNVNGVGLQNLEAQLIQVNAALQNMIDEKELCSTQPMFYPEENVSVDTLKNVEVNEVTQVEDYWSETVEELEVFQIEPDIIIA